MSQIDSSRAFQAALAGSRLFERLPTEALERLAATARPVSLAAGEDCERQEGRPRFLLLLNGLMRVYISSPQGLQATAYYLGPGDLARIAPLGDGGGRARTAALRPTHLIELEPRLFGQLLRTQRDFAADMTGELERRWAMTLAGLGIHMFGTVRQRVIQHVLSMLSQDGEDSADPVYVTQQELADAAGTVREVVGRVIRELRDTHHLDAARGRLTVRDRGLLEEELRSSFPDETSILFPR